MPESFNRAIVHFKVGNLEIGIINGGWSNRKTMILGGKCNFSCLEITDGMVKTTVAKFHLAVCKIKLEK